MNSEILSVSELNRAVAELLESEFGRAWVEGEISNLARPASGHIYFSLKDSAAQVRCAMFRGRNRNLKFEPENGMQVQVRAKVGLYQPRGEYQLIVDRLEPAGAGLLQQQFEALKQKLQQEGLFDPDARLAVPGHARGIAVITSRSGAAIRDVLSVIARRFPATPVSLYPVAVQGETSAPAICRALELADANGECDVILLVRGGGSLEDLWSFNEESVARAIHACATPVVSGVGHETDFTIADFVADLRAATPTAAAEAVTPDQQAWFQTLDWYHGRFRQLVAERLQRQGQQLGWLRQRLGQQHPLAHLQRMQQRVAQLQQGLLLRMRFRLQADHAGLASRRARLLAASPDGALRLGRQRLLHLSRSMAAGMENRLRQARSQLAGHSATLHALSPLKTLARGYSITSDASGRALTTIDGLAAGQVLTTRLHRGSVTSTVTTTSPGGEDD